MTLIRTERLDGAERVPASPVGPANQIADHQAPRALTGQPALAQTVRALHHAGRSQRAIARELNLDRRKVKQIIDQAA
jgi:hypothetical protein